MRWTDVDLKNGVWSKPAASTKQKAIHRAPLNAPARQLLAEIRSDAEKVAKNRDKGASEFVFPGRGRSGRREDVKRDWGALCVAAGIVVEKRVKNGGKERVTLQPTARLHDLRHTFASHLVSMGHSLPVIGALLGHTRAETTARYAHLFDDPLRQATERVGAMIANAGKEDTGAEIIQLESARAG
jgi:integrase